MVIDEVEFNGNLFDGLSVQEAYEKLVDLYGKDAWFVYSYTAFDGDICFLIRWQREETEKEQQRRLANERKAKEREAKIKAKKQAEELKLLAQLRKKYPDA